MRRWLVWNLLYPLHERAKGHPTLRILKELEAAEFLSAEELQQKRMHALRRLLRYGQANVPYVRALLERAGMQPDDFREMADLERLPLTRKADVRQHRAELRSGIAKKFMQYSTGGSTGDPLTYDLPIERASSWAACRLRGMRWWGLTIGDREYALWGAPVELSRQDRLRNLRDTFLRTRLLSAFEMTEAVMSSYLDRMEKAPPRMIFGYPSSVYLLCLHAQKEGRSLRRLGVKAAFVTGEVLFPDQREVISKVLNCPVATGYGGRDSGFIAHECPQGSLHIMADATIVEVVDSRGRPVAPGELGEIVVTDLYSREFPFLRYATGDMGILAARPCACGRPLPLLEKVEGRRTDFIVAPDGTIMHALSVIYVMREVEGVERFRIRQTHVDRFHIQLVRGPKYAAESEKRIREGLRRRLKHPVEVTIEYLDALPAEGSGKFRQVISDVSVNEVAGLRPAAQQNVAS